MNENLINEIVLAIQQLAFIPLISMMLVFLYENIKVMFLLGAPSFKEYKRKS